MKKRKGVTLIEVIISLAIIGIIATVILNMFNFSIMNIFSIVGIGYGLFTIKRMLRVQKMELS